MIIENIGQNSGKPSSLRADAAFAQSYNGMGVRIGIDHSVQPDGGRNLRVKVPVGLSLDEIAQQTAQN